MERMKIEGIKLSDPLLMVTFLNLSNVEDHVSRFCQVLATNQVNLIFLSTANAGADARVSFCVAAEDQSQVKEIIGADTGLEDLAEFISPVGLISLFHHQSSLKMLGLTLNIFGKIKLPLYGLASSLSALVFITDYDQLDRAVKAIREYLDVPSDQIYLKPETRVKQSQKVRE